MKKLCLLLAGAALCSLLADVNPAVAQGTAFTYQGRLNNNASPANGNYDLVFGLFDGSNGVSQVGNTVTNLNTGVNNGLFTVTLDFGPGIFNGANLWLQIGVRTNGGIGFTLLNPLQALTPTPYAVFASTASNLSGTLPAAQLSGAIPATQLTGLLPSAQLGGTYSNPVLFNNGADQFDGTFYGAFFGSSFIGGSFTGSFIGNGSGLAGVNAATVGGVNGTNIWQTGGNANTTPGVNFLGTTDTNALELKVNNTRVLRLEPDSRGANAGNLIGGYVSNAIVQPNSGGDFIGGGGFNGGANIINSNSSGVFIGAGSANQVGPNANDSLIVGGKYNAVQTSGSAVVGGYYNTNVADLSFIGAGYHNSILSNSTYSAIVAGVGNLIDTNAAYSFIGGGDANSIQTYNLVSTIGGGYGNIIQGDSNSWGGFFITGSTIAGGAVNTILSNSAYATIGGGLRNTIQTNSFYGTIGGGAQNTNTGYYATIPGGIDNVATTYAFAAGRRAKATNQGAFVWSDSQGVDFGSTANNQFAVRASGGVNFVTSGAGMSLDGEPVLAGGFGNSSLANQSFTGGGSFNTILPGADYATIAGGLQNLAYGAQAVIGGGQGNIASNVNVTIGGGGQNFASGLTATISGGFQNQALNTDATIGGGYSNVVTGYRSTIVGGALNLASASFGSIGGGESNVISSDSSTIGGGFLNTIQANSPGSTISGGTNNTIQTNALYSTIGGGNLNTILANSGAATINGGMGNTIQTNAPFSTIGGGLNNTILANVSFAASGGGLNNTNGGLFSTVPGGTQNAALGSTSFAAGNRAKANHSGAFVWADSQNADFASTANDQFLIRANGGVGININNPQSALHVNGDTRVTGLLRSGSETGSSEMPSPAGLVVRRVNSISIVAGQIVARTDNLTLERDGTAGGFLIRYPASTGNLTIACMGMNSSGTPVNFYTALANPGSAGTLVIYSNAQSIVHFECTFGRTYQLGQHLTQVTLSRYGADTYWSGNATSTYNQ
jgi:hypothetical protein